MTNELIASYDEEYVYVIADKFEGKAEIVFSNGKNVVYDVFSVCFAEGEKKAFPMDRMGEGKCFIEIKTDNCYYYGCFEITQ